MKPINWESGQSTFCCGLVEIGDIHNYDSDDWWRDESYTEKTPEHALQKMREQNSGFPLMFNFIRDVPKDFRDLIQAQRDWILVHKWRNPNSGNIITCGFLTNGSNQAKRKGV